ncbi:MAG: DUF3810 domain-containing protein [Clostridia bacterium]|nr:DUF3810 domain-containing protein [Clostridia bacterium]
MNFSKEKLTKALKRYCPTPALILFALALTAVIVHITSELSAPFSDFFNRYISSIIRGIPAVVTSILPFSLAETLILFIPVLFISIMAICVKVVNQSITRGIRYIVGLSSLLSLLYTLFVFTTAVAYNGTSLAYKLGLEETTVSVEELRETAEYLIEKMNTELDEIDFSYGKSSSMPYSVSEMNDRLMDAYDKACEKYKFIPRLKSRIKQVALSELMTYTHISGLYSYYTGEANLNINFPDYNLPFTAAHELAHQRGIMPENEANFVAFLVCIQSDDPYIRYSGYMNMYEYFNSALYSADYDTFAEVYTSLDARVRGEMSAYNEFFEKYRDNTAADVSSALNDTYLKSQGVSEGEHSYGMVVDLAVAYVAEINK